MQFGRQILAFSPPLGERGKTKQFMRTRTREQRVNIHNRGVPINGFLIIL